MASPIFTQIFYFVLYAVFLIDFLQMFYIEDFNNMIINVSFYCISLFSRAELFYIKTKRVFRNVYIYIVDSNPQIASILENNLSNNQQSDVDFIIDGKIVYSTTKKILLSDNSRDGTSIAIPKDFDMIVYSKPVKINETDYITYKKVLNYLPVEEPHFDVVIADYRFILTEIIIGDKTINTSFSHNKHNYFVSGNMLNESFIKYFFKQYHVSEFTSDYLFDPKDYKIRVLDQNVNEVFFDQQNQLQIEKENYTIIN